MPGHVKLGNQKGEDPDPEPYLVVSMEMKREDMMKPYDSKKSYYCPDGKGGFAECLLEKAGEKESEVMIGHIVSLISYIICHAFEMKRLVTKIAMSNIFVLNFRKRLSKTKSLDKSIHLSLKNARIWLT